MRLIKVGAEWVWHSSWDLAVTLGGIHPLIAFMIPFLMVWAYLKFTFWIINSLVLVLYRSTRSLAGVLDSHLHLSASAGWLSGHIHGAVLVGSTWLHHFHLIGGGK